MTRGKAAYNLEEVKRWVAGGAFVITLQARRDAYGLGLDARDVRDCILGLSAGEFHKSMRSEAVPELDQDVYQTVYGEFELYVKLQMRRDGPVVVVSSKLR
ncbi:MAG: type II toxin-antitoxin system MqsR family toxin [Dehalococcoidia bacterium]|nr:MAG: type II toxin-antitoxin system MqsR family toxin [Dehalococcoidia bacterium]